MAWNNCVGVLQREVVDNQLHSVCEGGVGGKIVIMMVKKMIKFFRGSCKGKR